MSWLVLAEAQGSDIVHPQIRSVRDSLGKSARLAAISRLLELGILQTKYLELNADLMSKLDQSAETELLKYSATALGKAVFIEVIRRMKFPENLDILRKLFDEPESPDEKDPSSKN